MTLHQTIDIARRFLFSVGAVLGAIIVIFLLFRLGIIIKNMIFPPQIQPPTVAYGKLPQIAFPPNVTDTKLTFSLNTITGTLPQFYDRLNIFEIEQRQPNFLNLDKTREKVGQLGFIKDDGTLVPEIKIDSATYQWIHKKNLERKLTFDIITFNFNLESNYLLSEILKPSRTTLESDAVNKVTSLLNAINLNPPDLDITKTSNKNDINLYITTPQLFSVTNGQLVPTKLLSETEVIRVDLYQKDVIYKLDTGIPEVTGVIKKEDVTLPIVYPRPPYSTMAFWVASTEFGNELVAANFFYQKPFIEQTPLATYPIKTANEALEELQNGKGYIAAFHGENTSIQIKKVFLAYYLGNAIQKYLMPIFVFEGNNGFFAYVSAVKNDWVE